MTALGDARAHLAKAREFLEVAETALDLSLFNPATSDAVISGINAKDAICLSVTGATRKADAHAEAISELRRSGPAGARMAPTLARLLRVKTKSQYQPDSIAAADARKAVEWAEKLVETAAKVVSGR